jgi:hypothetical protein
MYTGKDRGIQLPHSSEKPHSTGIRTSKSEASSISMTQDELSQHLPKCLTNTAEQKQRSYVKREREPSKINILIHSALKVDPNTIIFGVYAQISSAYLNVLTMFRGGHDVDGSTSFYVNRVLFLVACVIIGGNKLSG